MAYYKGNGIEENHEKVFEWWMKAAEQGVPGAQFNIGLMYRNGDGAEEHLPMAMYWLGKSYRLGMKEAKPEMEIIQSWVAKDMAKTGTEETSSKYQKEVDSFIKEKGENIDRFIVDCKERKMYKPEIYRERISDKEVISINLDICPFPTSVRNKGFKECLLVRLMNSMALNWESRNRGCAHAYLEMMEALQRKRTNFQRKTYGLIPLRPYVLS